MQRAGWIAAWLFAVVMLGCAPVRVTTEANPDADLSRYRTFTHALPSAESARPADARPTPEMTALLQDEIDALLQAKGYRRAMGDVSDMTVEFRVTGRSRVQRVNAGDSDTDFYVPEEVFEGKLVVSLLDTRDGTRVWRGIGQTESVTSGQLVRESPRKALLEALRKMLAEFPPAAVPDP